jgi:uncharacterized protein (DUF1778 family)
MGHRLVKEETINFRVDSETKEFVKKAAKLSGLALSAYMISKSKEAAMQDIIRHDQANRILLSDSDFTQAKTISESPAKITPKLQAAMKKHLKK